MVDKRVPHTNGAGTAAATVAAGLPAVEPDLAEADLDNIVPSIGYDLVPTVGLGGSAGSFPALQSFFAAMPADSGLVFVVVLHLSPEHDSALPSVIQRWTSMKVQEATQGEVLLANHVYVIPPGKHLTATNGHLRLTDLERDHGKRVVVDLFFRSLADTHGAHAAAVVLSGGDGDGALGVKRIKERGGLTIAQDPDDAEHDGMPRAALESGMVDWVLNAGEMPARILGYFRHESKLQLPPEDGPLPIVAPQMDEADETVFREVLVFLRTRTGHDFSYYKRATILRRIARRMQVNGVETMTAYLAVLRMQPGESGALLKDLLISVTNFFRDREAFQSLEERIPLLFRGKGPGDVVRVWCPGCATGEEAYSVAMMLVEHAQTLEHPAAIQVFGCDLDEEAIQAARAGHFPEAITADVSELRLRRFFVKEHRGYRVRRELREKVLFAAHDLLKDAPFSRLDLVTCRNLLIYLNRDAQGRAFDIFHFALKPEGLLFIGMSETIDEGGTQFAVVDKKHRLYQRRTDYRAGVSVPMRPGGALAHQLDTSGEQDTAGREVVLPTAALHPEAVAGLQGLWPIRDTDRISRTELHFKLIERFGPPSILVDREHDIQHLSETAGRFLHFVGGQPTANLLRLVLPELRVDLRTVLYRAAQTGAMAEAFLVETAIDGERQVVDIRVIPASDVAPDFLLVTFTLRDSSLHAQQPVTASPPEPLVQHLERELEQMKGHLRDTVEQYEGSTEELKASNEELQAMNEELRAATEELETSREELQSINEELTTVNHESRGKVDELAQANSDLQNLMSATAIATVFLDRELRVMRYTESAAPIFKLIPSDIGRPLSDLQHHLDYPDLEADASKVLAKLSPVAREVHGPDEVSYMTRMLPYRSHDDRIAGIVLTLVDITNQERTKRQLAEDLEVTERLRAVAETLIGENGSQDLFEAIADAAMFIMQADAAMVQILDNEAGTLHVLAAHGLPTSFAQHFAKVDASAATPWGQALEAGRRTVVDFTRKSPSGAGDFDHWHREVAGLRCGHFTPLVARSGYRTGLLSMHWTSLREPTARQLRYLDLLVRQAADAIERQQGAEAMRRHLDELTRFNEAAVGRENRMIELKKEINALAAAQGLPPRYSLDFEDRVD